MKANYENESQLGSRANTSSGSQYLIVGGNLIGIKDDVLLVIDFSIFEPKAESGVLERITCFTLTEGIMSEYGLIDKTGKEIVPCNFHSELDALNAYKINKEKK
jgi:hypothetical protein